MALTPEQLITLKSEIDNDPILSGQGRDIKISGALNTEGSALVESWILSDKKKDVDKQTLLNLIPDEELVAFQDYLVSVDVISRAMKFRLDAAPTINMADVRVRENIDALSVGEVFSADTQATLKRLGEVKTSRSQELFGIQITESDVTAARGL